MVKHSGFSLPRPPTLNVLIEKALRYNIAIFETKQNKTGQLLCGKGWCPGDSWTALLQPPWKLLGTWAATAGERQHDQGFAQWSTFGETEMIPSDVGKPG